MITAAGTGTDVRVVRREQTVVVGFPVVGPFAELGALVPAAWQRVFARRDELPQPVDGAFAELSCYLGDGAYHEVVGVALPRPPRVPGSWVVAVAPEGEYAHHRHEGPVEAIGEGFGVLLDAVRAQGRTPGGVKLDVGYRADGRPGPHDLYVHLPG
ncbi:hypothetical protein [Kineococcus auxinigenes]|uniref:hypothetical protein n=1 Tax=unclassified Kineococcus TaxID=2621656 RepID=UPI003D7D4EA8